MKDRDFQRSRVYAWERAACGDALWSGTMTVQECEEMVRRVWQTERGRYGLARRPPPQVVAGRGARGSVRRIALGHWARNPWVVLHELAHGLCDRVEPRGAHGPRFVGILIGLLCRHLSRDRDELLPLAYECGLHVYERAIGTVPRIAIAEKVEKHLPGTPVQLAVRINAEQQLGISYRQVQGAALRLVRAGRARWRGKVLEKMAEPQIQRSE